MFLLFLLPVGDFIWGEIIPLGVFSLFPHVFLVRHAVFMIVEPGPFLVLVKRCDDVVEQLLLRGLLVVVSLLAVLLVLERS